MVGILVSLMRSIGAAVTINVPWYDIPGAIDLILRREKVILDACKAPGFNGEALRRATAHFADIH